MVLLELRARDMMGRLVIGSLRTSTVLQIERYGSIDTLKQFAIGETFR